MSNIQKIAEDIVGHIYSAYLEAIKSEIKINQIIIDEDLAKTNHIYFKNVNGSIMSIHPMILGLAITYKKNLKKDGYNFIMCFNPTLDKKPKTLADYTTAELLEELQRRNEENE